MASKDHQDCRDAQSLLQGRNKRSLEDGSDADGTSEVSTKRARYEPIQRSNLVGAGDQRFDAYPGPRNSLRRASTPDCFLAPITDENELLSAFGDDDHRAALQGPAEQIPIPTIMQNPSWKESAVITQGVAPVFQGYPVGDIFKKRFSLSVNTIDAPAVAVPRPASATLYHPPPPIQLPPESANRKQSVIFRNSIAPLCDAVVDAMDQIIYEQSESKSEERALKCTKCGLYNIQLQRSDITKGSVCLQCSKGSEKKAKPAASLSKETGRGRSISPVTSTRPPKPQSQKVCFNCATNATPIWRRDGEGNQVCNACGLFWKIHQASKPLVLADGRAQGRGISRSTQSPSAPLPILQTTPGAQPLPSPSSDSSGTMASTGSSELAPPPSPMDGTTALLNRVFASSLESETTVLLNFQAFCQNSSDEDFVKIEKMLIGWNRIYNNVRLNKLKLA